MEGNCDGNVCSPPAGTPVLLAPWHWAATIMFIIFCKSTLILPTLRTDDPPALIMAIITLTCIHRKRRYAHYRKVQDYYIEQMQCVLPFFPTSAFSFFYFLINCLLVRTEAKAYTHQSLSYRRSILALHTAASEKYAEKVDLTA